MEVRREGQQDIGLPIIDPNVHLICLCGRSASSNFLYGFWKTALLSVSAADEIIHSQSTLLLGHVMHCTHRNEGFPKRDIWFQGALDQGSARCPELLGRRRRRRRHLETQVDIQTRKLLVEVCLRFWGRGERYLRMEAGVLHRISLRTS